MLKHANHTQTCPNMQRKQNMYLPSTCTHWQPKVLWFVLETAEYERAYSVQSQQGNPGENSSIKISADKPTQTCYSLDKTVPKMKSKIVQMHENLQKQVKHVQIRINFAFMYQHAQTSTREKFETLQQNVETWRNRHKHVQLLQNIQTCTTYRSICEHLRTCTNIYKGVQMHTNLYNCVWLVHMCTSVHIYIYN